jgi:cobalt/nickel transport system permease protein
MHIPDGYLSPATCAVGYLAALPMWATASRKVTKVVKTRNVPTLAVFAAVSFLVMMFNLPVPGGTTAHAVGGVVIAICLGPWAAVIAISVALLIQALLFGDGGLLSYGMNVVNLAVILPFVGLFVYRALAGRAPLRSRRRVVAAAIAGYVGINAAGFAAAVQIGIQPDLFHTASGAPLYSPYSLSQSIPAMAIAHLTVAGAAEAIMTAGILAYLLRADVTLLVPNHPGIPVTAGGQVPSPRQAPRQAPRRLSPATVALGFVAVMVVLSPLGLLAPGGAFGEDAPAGLKLGELGLSTVPAGLQQYTGFWSHTLLGGYGFNSGDHASLGYVLSAVVGIAVVAGAIFLIGTIVRVVRAMSHTRGDQEARGDRDENASAGTRGTRA